MKFDEFDLFLYPWKKKPCVKIIENFSFPSGEKKKTREKILKSVRENFRPPVKKSKKVCVKIMENFSFPSREKKNPHVKKS